MQLNFEVGHAFLVGAAWAAKATQFLRGNPGSKIGLEHII